MCPSIENKVYNSGSEYYIYIQRDQQNELERCVANNDGVYIYININACIGRLITGNSKRQLIFISAQQNGAFEYTPLSFH